MYAAASMPRGDDDVQLRCGTKFPGGAPKEPRENQQCARCEYYGSYSDGQYSAFRDVFGTNKPSGYSRNIGGSGRVYTRSVYSGDARAVGRGSADRYVRQFPIFRQY